MTGPRKSRDYARQHPKDERAYGERNEDPYQSRGKYPEPSVCIGCGAVFHKGRWQWGMAPESAHKHLCPACQRIHDRVPAGILTVSGAFFNEHRQEILNLIHNAEAKERAEHPLQRIMRIEGQNAGIVVSFTDMHLARGIGEGLHHAYQGEVYYQYTDKEGVLRVQWTR